MPASDSASAMPLASSVTSADFSEEKQMPSSLWPSSERSLSLAVMTATRAPASASAARMVPARRYLASFIITSAPDSGSQKKFPQMPCTDGGAPVTIDRLLGLVNDGTTQSAVRQVPRALSDARNGALPASIAWLM